MSRSDSIEMITAYAPSYASYAEVDNIAHGAYGNRVANAGLDQLHGVVETLRRHGNSRQAVVALWHPSDLKHAIELDKKDLPCTLTWQFILRNDGLHMIVNMRSNDIWKGMPYDVFCFTCVQRLVAGMLNVPTATYTHNVGSLHLYERNYKAAQEAVDKVVTHDDLGWEPTVCDTFEYCDMAVKVEEAVRKGLPLEEVMCPRAGFLRDLVCVVARKWGHTTKVHSEVLDRCSS